MVDVSPRSECERRSDEGVMPDKPTTFGMPARRFEPQRVGEYLRPRRVENAGPQVEQQVVESLAPGQAPGGHHLSREERGTRRDLDLEGLHEPRTGVRDHEIRDELEVRLRPEHDSCPMRAELAVGAVDL